MSFLKVRPVFHSSERRIRAHIFLCVLAYLIENHLAQRLNKAAAGFTARAAFEPWSACAWSSTNCLRPPTAGS